MLHSFIGLLIGIEKKNDVFSLKDLFTFLVKDKILYISMIFFVITNYMNAAFLGVYLKDIGFSETNISESWLVSVLFEFIATYFIFNLLKNKITIYQIIFISIIGSAIRFILYSYFLVPDMTLVLIAATGHFFTWGLMHLALVEVIKNKYKQNLHHLKECLQIYSIIRYFGGPLFVSILASFIISFSYDLYWYLAALFPIIGFFLIIKLKWNK
jgi:hypothetical protein